MKQLLKFFLIKVHEQVYRNVLNEKPCFVGLFTKEALCKYLYKRSPPHWLKVTWNGHKEEKKRMQHFVIGVF